MARLRLIIDETIRRVLMPLRDDERALLEQSVLAEGIRDPLVVWRRNGELILLDGHHRYQLAQKHGLDFSVVEMEFDDESHAVQWVLRNQLARRNLTDEQRALIIGRLYNQVKLEPLQKVSASGVNFTPETGSHATARYVGSMFGVGEKTVRNAADFAKAVDALAEIEPKAAEIVLLGKVPDAKTALPKVEPELLPKVAEHIAHGSAKSVKEAVRAVKQEEAKRQVEKTNPQSNLPSTIQLHTGDFREVLATLPPESVDAIITDPPYLLEHFQLFEPLAEHAARLLKPHGVLVVMVAHLYLYEYMTLLNQHLRYRWICVYHMGDTKANVSAAKIAASWKPLLVYVRHDAENLRFVCSDYFSGARGNSDGVEKTLHHWQQSLDGFTEIVQRFTEPGETVLDPFMGSGTTGVACLYLNRRFIGCDNDPSAVAVATKRIRETYGVLSSSATPRLV
jgi:methylase of polypeptide subunit release factors